MMSRIKSLFGRRGGGGLLLGVPGVPAGMGGALSSSPSTASPLPGIILPGARPAPAPLLFPVHARPRLSEGQHGLC